MPSSNKEDHRETWTEYQVDTFQLSHTMPCPNEAYPPGFAFEAGKLYKPKICDELLFYIPVYMQTTATEDDDEYKAKISPKNLTQFDKLETALATAANEKPASKHLMFTGNVLTKTIDAPFRSNEIKKIEYSYLSFLHDKKIFYILEFDLWELTFVKVNNKTKLTT